MSSISKGKFYKKMLKRFLDAKKAGYYLEASWIAYANFEDRIYSVLDKTGGIPLNNRGIPISIHHRLVLLKRRRNSDPKLKRAFYDENIIDDVMNWKNRRNPLMHSLMKTPRKIEDVNNELKSLAEDSESILRDFNSAVLRFNKLSKK